MEWCRAETVVKTEAMKAAISVVLFWCRDGDRCYGFAGPREVTDALVLELDSESVRLPEAIEGAIQAHIARCGSLRGVTICIPKPFRGRGSVDIETIRSVL